MSKFRSHLAKFKKFFLQHVLRRKYLRIGQCNCCGACCREIYVKHATNKTPITSEELFYDLQAKHGFYRDLELIGKDEIGLLFACKNLDRESKRCKTHKFRAKICRDYPREEIFTMGGTMGEKCGFSFVPIVPFSEVLEGVSAKQERVGWLFWRR
jgi:hypothetical protein